MRIRHARGFTLVEMTIVIGIIILLAGLTLAVSVSVIQGSEVRQTELTIRLLDAAIQEWEAQADRQVTYGIDDQPYNQNEVYEIREPVFPLTTDESALVTNKLMAILLRSQGSKQILAQIDPEFARFDRVDRDDDGTDDAETLIVTDAWGNPLSAVLPGRMWVSSDFNNFDYVRNPDGTIQTETERLCGIATNRAICFVSAGPDGKLGSLDPGDGEGVQRLAQDNLYSYVPAAPQSP